MAYFSKFQKLLDERGLTIHKVSVDTGIPQTSLYEWKSGRSTPKVDKLQILAKYFGVPITYFLEE